MGFFSFKTTDTNQSIPNRHSDKDTFTVYMVDIDNNIYTEQNYDGYGVFGGKDFFELLNIHLAQFQSLVRQFFFLL